MVKRWFILGWATVRKPPRVQSHQPFAVSFAAPVMVMCSSRKVRILRDCFLQLVDVSVSDWRELAPTSHTWACQCMTMHGVPQKYCLRNKSQLYVCRSLLLSPIIWGITALCNCSACRCCAPVGLALGSSELISATEQRNSTMLLMLLGQVLVQKNHLTINL